MELAPVVSGSNRIAPIGHALLRLVAAVAVATSIEVKPGLAVPAPPAIQASGGLQFQSQGGGTPNVFSGYLFAPLGQGPHGEVLFLDVIAGLNLGGALVQQTNPSAAVSTRLGYRFLSNDHRWIYGLNAGIDTRQAYSQYAFQVGAGAEALHRDVELRANAFIPFSNKSELYATGWTNASLINNQLILDGWNRYIVSLGGINLEVGVPLARWGKESLWLYGAYYYLDGNYVSASSGVRGRAELRVGHQLSVGGSLAYDNLFQWQASGYLRYGAKPFNGNAKDAIDAAETTFLAQRGLPVQRDTEIRMISALQTLPGSVATNPSNNGSAWVVRCTGATTSAYGVSCANASLDGLLATAGSNDVLLAGGGAASNLAGQPLVNGRPTLRLPVGTQLAGSGNAPTLPTQFGPVNLTPIFGATLGAQPAFSNGVISIGSNTTIRGFSFSNSSITNYSTSNVLISGNTFVGSYSDNPTNLTDAQTFGAINGSANALAAIDFNGVSSATIMDNTFLYPQVQTYGLEASSDLGGSVSLCNQANLCLAGNAIRLNRSSDITISNNTVIGALEEAFSINNSHIPARINGNNVSGIRFGPSSSNPSSFFAVQAQGQVLTTPRSLHTASALPDGRILVAGGYNQYNQAVTSAEIYDPATGLLTPTGAMHDGRIAATATQLSDGRILMVGGQDSTGTALSSVEIYNPATGQFTLASNLGTSRLNSTATTMNDGTVLVTGGYTGAINGASSGIPLASAEIYNPSTNSWQTAGSMGTTRRNHTATLLSDGTVLVAGGYNGSYINSPEIYNPSTQSFVATASSMSVSRRYPTATLLPSGQVLFAGGFQSTINGALATTELYTKSSATSFSLAAPLDTARGRHTATSLVGGNYVLIAGGFDGSATLSSVEIYGIAANQFTPIAAMGGPRYRHTESLLPNGSVLITGGDNGSGALATTEIYIPFNN